MTNDAREADLQHEALDPICSRVFEEEASRRRLIKNRPQLLAAPNDVGNGNLIVVMKVRYLAQTTIDGLEVLVDLVDQRVGVRVLGGVAAGDHTERSLFVDQSREMVELRRRIRSDKIKTGLSAARERGAAAGRPRVVDNAKYTDIVSRREQGESLRSIARAVDVSVGTVHNTLAYATSSGQM